MTNSRITETPLPPLVRVFISCPGDLANQREIVRGAIGKVQDDPEFAGQVRLEVYAYENVVPARVGMNPQDAVNSYMLRPDDTELFICMLGSRMGTPLANFPNPETKKPYQSGTEYEFLTAYAAAQRLGLPVILLYRAQRPALPADAPEEARIQYARVEAFFARFVGGNDLKGLALRFADDAQLANLIRRDVARVLHDDLLPRLRVRKAAAAGDPVYHALPHLPTDFVDRPAAREALRKALVGSRPAVGVVAAAALHGIGGLGKTLLARAICDDPVVREAFPDGVLWATVGVLPDIARLQREWIAALGGNVAAASSPEAGRSEISRLLQDRAMLLVLDDVWSADAAEAFEVAAPRCRVLITTRDATTAKDASLIPLDLMGQQQCRELLRAAARGKVQDVATLDAIAERVDYLPLSLQVVGALLGKDIPWPDIRQAMDTGELPEIREGQLNLFEALDASVWFLPEAERARYRELAIFPTDEPLVEAVVARLWARTGGMGAFGAKRLLAELRDRSLVQVGNTLHDLQVDYLRAVVDDAARRPLHAALCDSYGDPATWADTLDAAGDDGYGWRRLAQHLHDAGPACRAALVALLTDVTYVQRRLERQGTASSVRDLRLCPSDATITTLADVLAAGAVVLDQEPRELLNQITGRVGRLDGLHDLPQIAEPHFRLRTQSLRPPDPGLLATLQGHTGPVLGCALSADGTRALSASDDRTLRLWETSSGRELRRFEGHTDPVWGCALSADGTRALSASADQTLRLWETSSGRELAHWRIEGELYGCALGPALLALAGDSLGGVHILDIVGVVVAVGGQSRQDAGATDGVPVAAGKPTRGEPAKHRGIWPFRRRSRP